jgi:hypothetical protein
MKSSKDSKEEGVSPNSIILHTQKTLKFETPKLKFSSIPFSQRGLVNFYNSDNVGRFSVESVMPGSKEESRSTQPRWPPSNVQVVLFHSLHQPHCRVANFCRLLSKLQTTCKSNDVQAGI